MIDNNFFLFFIDIILLMYKIIVQTNICSINNIQHERLFVNIKMNKCSWMISCVCIVTLMINVQILEERFELRNAQSIRSNILEFLNSFAPISSKDYIFYRARILQKLFLLLVYLHSLDSSYVFQRLMNILVYETYEYWYLAHTLF